MGNPIFQEQSSHQLSSLLHLTQQRLRQRRLSLHRSPLARRVSNLVRPTVDHPLRLALQEQLQSSSSLNTIEEEESSETFDELESILLQTIRPRIVNLSFQDPSMRNSHFTIEREEAMIENREISVEEERYIRLRDDPEEVLATELPPISSFASSDAHLTQPPSNSARRLHQSLNPLFASLSRWRAARLALERARRHLDYPTSRNSTESLDASNSQRPNFSRIPRPGAAGPSRSRFASSSNHEQGNNTSQH